MAETTQTSVHCLLLAAGSSRRFGSPKAIHLMPNGKPMIINTLELYQSTGIDITVVIQAGDRDLAAVLRSSGAAVLENQSATLGLSQSIVKGVEQSPESMAWLIGLADMPYVSPNTLASLIRLADSDRIIIPRSNTNGVYRLGNPVCIGHAFKAHLLQLSGDIGAKNLIKQNAPSIDFLDCDDQGIHHDIDRPSDIVR